MFIGNIGVRQYRVLVISGVRYGVSSVGNAAVGEDRRVPCHVTVTA